MKNLKKVLALALAFALSLSLFAGAAFSDQADIGINYADDVNMLVELGILGGYPDGSFKPANNITRAEATKLIYALKYGEDASEGQIFAGSASKFSDVEGNANVLWAKGYINYCANQGIVGGLGNGKFNPNGNVTVAELTKMLLVTLGCDAEKEGYKGSNWMGNVVSDAMELGVFNGWKGDPTVPATRELAAKLIRNTIFAPVYVYNPVTGVGSQLNPLNNEDNETLGEKILGLHHIEGLVVANENMYINYDENGEVIYTGPVTAQAKVDAHIVSGNYAVTGSAVGAAAEGKTTIYYEYANGNQLYKDLIDIDRAVSNELIGTKVDVYYTDDYGKIEVIGDVIVNSDTVVYNVNASDIDIIPNGDSTSAKNITPYISILADGKEIKVRSRQSEITAVPANTQNYSGDLFADYFYFANATDPNTNSSAAFGKYVAAELVRPVLNGADHAFIADLGEARSENYRVVSLDGGASVSYIFRTTQKDLKKVGSISESAGTISLNGGVVENLEDVVINGDVKKGDQVMAWYEAETLYIEPVEKVTGVATVVGDLAISVNGTEYKIDDKQFALIPTGGSRVDNIAEYFRLENNNNENTAYTIYDGYVVKIEGEGVVADVSQYAAVIDSSFDYDEGVAKVKLAFADETTGVYTVSRVDSKELSVKGTEATFTHPNAFADDHAVGAIFRYRVSGSSVNLYTDNGRVTNKNYLTANATKAGVANYYYVDDTARYATTDASVLFILYGGLSDALNPQNPLSYEPVAAAVYKFSDMDNRTGAALELYDGNGAKQTNNAYGYVLTNGVVESVVAATLPVGLNRPSITPKTGGFAYVLDAKYVYNFETSKFYANFKMIGEDGLVEAKTIEDIDIDLGDSANAKINGVPQDLIAAGTTGKFDRGAIANAKVTDGVIKSIEILAAPSALANTITAGSTNTYAYVTVASVGSRAIAVYPYKNATQDTENDKAISFNIVENAANYVAIAIDGDDFVEGADIETVTRGEEIPANAFNAIIHINNSGEIDKVISLHNNY